MIKWNQDSIIFSSIRSFCVSFFGLFGAAVALIITFVFFAAALSSKKDITAPASYKVIESTADKKLPITADLPVFLNIEIKDIIGTKLLNTETVYKQLEDSRHIKNADSRIKGIILTINSPGGTVVDSDNIYNAIKLYKEKYQIPVYAHVQGLCASGGMYIACAADKIYSNEISLIGHVGVLMKFTNISETLEKIGVKTLTLTKGQGKDDMNMTRPWREGEEQHYRYLMDWMYDRFLNIVTTARTNISRDDLINKHGARVYPADIAQQMGYVDVVSKDSQQAIKDLATHTLGQGASYEVIQITKENWVADLLEAKAPLFSAKIEMPFSQIRKTALPTSDYPFLYLYQPQSFAAE